MNRIIHAVGVALLGGVAAYLIVQLYATIQATLHTIGV